MIDTTSTTHVHSRARLSGARSQRAFRLLLDALARPGTVHDSSPVDLPAGVPAPLLLPLALADVEVGVAVVSGDPGEPWSRFLVDVTGAATADPSTAGIVVLLGGFGPADVLALRRGSDDSPELGARVAVACRSLRPIDSAADLTDAHGTGPTDEVVVTLHGPGVDGTARLAVAGLPASVFEALSVANAGFPSGIDTWLLTPEGHVAAIPRSTHLSIEGR